MKISEFSSKYNLSNDTVRYYMKLNLLVPQKKGGHYNFDEECEKDIKEILRLKNMDFTLQEIKKILYFKRIGKLSSYQKNKYYQSLYKDKIKEIEKRIGELKESQEELKEKINKLDKINKNEKDLFGISLDALSLFSCPECNSELSLSAENIKNNQIIKGSLNCNCGKSLVIKEGIIYDIEQPESKQTIEDNHIEKYIQTTHPDFMDKSYNSMEWLKKELINENLKNKVILEPGTGYGYFLRQIYNKLPENSYYICVDNNPDLNRYLKSILEMSGKHTNVIFITSNLPKLPLKQNIVDILVDFTGTSCYCFENEDFLPPLLNEYLKQEVLFLATFIIYKHFGPNSIVDRKYRNNFRYEKLKYNLEKMGFKLKNEKKSEVQYIKESMGKYEDFAQLGDKIYSYQIKAKRWS
ncbi:MAG: MerR family transcriptional regulator [Halanaerobiales bacterium]|nr:MerR family transcriptional regulator [Halanaerobiales bacterium]